MAEQDRKSPGGADAVNRWPMTTWRQEADAARDASVLMRRVALTLPDDSTVRLALLEDAARFGVFARGRGVESDVADDLRAEISAAKRVAAERLLAAAA